MPAGGICPQCRSDVSPAARFCARCGFEFIATEAAAAWNFAKVLAAVVGTIIAILFVGGLCLTLVHQVEMSGNRGRVGSRPRDFDLQTATDNQRFATEHRNDPWWDSSEPDNMKAVFYGKEYIVGPGEWASIDIRSPVQSARFKYTVELEGLGAFRARPDGYAEREFAYPNPQNLQPYQLAGWCQILLVQPLDGSVHHVRVKYVRVERS